MTFVENDQTQYVFFSDPKTAGASADVLRRWLQPRLATCRSARRADATRRRPICNFPLYGARHATVCSKPASAEASAASKTLEREAPSSVGERRRRLRALWRQRRRWTEIFWRDSIVSMIVWEIKYLFEVLLFCILVYLEVRPNQTNTHTQLNGNYHC